MMRGHFDRQLVDHIIRGRNNEALAMLNQELAQAFDDSNHGSYYPETLLHCAAKHNNVVIARRLIELGANVDHVGSTTPLTRAVACNNEAIVQVLLEANARIAIVDSDGRSALQVGLYWVSSDPKVFKLLVGKLRMEASTNEELVEILIKAGCNMYHAAHLRDIDVMECMSKRKIDMNSKDYYSKMTALHVAGGLGDVNLANWLLKRGIDVDALDDMRRSALRYSVCSGKEDLVQLLLENGASPDVVGESNVHTALYAAFQRLHPHKKNEFVKCAELLLQHGASLPNSINLLDMFLFALNCPCDEAVKLLIAHLAMLEMLGKAVDKSVMYSDVDDEYRKKMSELRKYYEPCQQVLTIAVFKELSLLDLLNESDRKMKLLLRNEMFMREVERLSSEHKLKELYSYYYNSLMRRVEKASRVVKLEDEAILTICKIYEADYNQFYHFARGVVEYLNEADLKNLVQV